MAPKRKPDSHLESGSSRKSTHFRCKGSFPSAVLIIHRKREARAFPPEPSASRPRPPRSAAMGCLSRRPTKSELHLQSYAGRYLLAIGGNRRQGSMSDWRPRLSFGTYSAKTDSRLGSVMGAALCTRILSLLLGDPYKLVELKLTGRKLLDSCVQ